MRQSFQPVRYIAALLVFASLVLAYRPFAAAQSTGQWSAVQTLPYRPVHTTVLPNGKVLFFSYYSDSLFPQIWDPATNAVSATATAPFELFCSGHTLLADGRIFITGGYIADYTGFAHAIIYDPFQNTFTSVPDMNAGRWYPTNTVLPNGDVLVVSGDMTSNVSPDPLPQVYQLSTNSWRNLTTAQLQMPLYPVMLVAPNGLVFNAGPSRTTRYLDTSGTGKWTTVATMNFGAARDYGPGLMYDVGKVLEVGGGDPPTATAEIINLNSATPAWTNTGSMHFARRQHNAVIMPDGKVFVSGGSSGSGFDNSSTPVAPTEMWDPATGQWTVMASISEYRGYHSTAVLLPDGRVLSAGGNVGGPNAQIFSPPYLFAGARPTISSAPASVGYGQTLFIGTPDAANIKRVTFLKLGSTTHTFDQSQRFMPLTFTQATGGLNVSFPSSANIAPPGHYMLFLLNSAGVPSVAAIVQIVAGGGPTTGTISGKVTNTSGTALSGVLVSGGGATTSTLADGTYTLPNVPPGSVTLTASLTGYQSASETVTVTAGQSTSAPTLQLTPTSSGTVTGKVADGSGNGIASATVTGGGQTTTTDATGNYTLTNLPVGSLTLTASAAGFSNGTVTVTVVANTTTTAPTFTLSSNVGSVTGKVTNSTGSAIAGATVQWTSGSVTTNSSGVYTLNSLPLGPIQLTASASGFVSQTQTVTISSGTTTTANFTLATAPTTGTITGKVTNVSSGGPIAGASVTWSGGSTTTDGTGVYTLNNVTLGTIPVTTAASGFVSQTVNVTVAAGTPATANFALSAVSTTGTITGTITNSATGGALAGATVLWSGGSVISNSSGVYTLNNVAAGTIQLTVSATGFATQTRSVTVTAGATTTASFALTAVATSGTVTGKISNISTGGAISGAKVAWSGGSTTTNTSGIYSLSNVSTGVQTITASATGYITRSLAATVTGGATSTLNIPIATGGKINVKVTNGTTAISGATVKLNGGVVATTVTGTTDSSGNFLGPWVPIGTYTVTVSKTSFTTQSKSATASTGLTTTVTFSTF